MNRGDHRCACRFRLLVSAAIYGGVLVTVGEAVPGAQDSVVAAAETEESQTPQQTICVEAVGPEGKPLAGAKILACISIKEPFEASREYSCDARGTTIVELPRTIDSLRLWALKDGYVGLAMSWGDIRRIPERFTFKLQKGSVIGGFVKNEDGRAIVGAMVEVKLVSQGGGDRHERLSNNAWLAYGDDACRTDAEGRWTLNNVPEGDDVKVLLKVSHRDYISDYLWGVMQQYAKVTTASLRQQTGTIVMAKGIRVTGSVTDPQGKPVAGAVIIWGDDPYGMDGSQEVRTDERGIYRFPPLPPMPTTVTVIAQEWAPEMKKITITWENPPVPFQLKPGKTLRLRFVDESGKPVPEVTVGILEWRGGRSLYNRKHPSVLDTKIPRMSDNNGIYQWTWAPPDQMGLYFSKEEYQKAGEYTADGVEHEVKLSR